MDWRENNPVQPASTVMAVDTVTPAVAPPLATEPPVEQQPLDTALSPTELPPAPTAVAMPAEATQMPAQTSQPPPRILMKFTQPSWVRVTDRDGKEVFNKTKPGNSEDVIEGTPPFKVEVGNAAGVQLNYNGQPVDLAPHTKANVARLTLE
jgi:cytoskeleton protein RodZ